MTTQTVVPIYPEGIDTSILTRNEQTYLAEVWQFYLRYPVADIQKNDFLYALLYSYTKHTQKKRKNEKDSMFIHDLRCAYRCLIAGLDIEMAIIMMAHEYGEDDGWSKEELIEKFGLLVGNTIWAQTKPPPVFSNSYERTLKHIELMEETIIETRNGLIPLGRAIDCCDNTRNTSGLNDEQLSWLFTKTSQIILPFLKRQEPFVTLTHRAFYRLFIFDIQFACNDYYDNLSTG